VALTLEELGRVSLRGAWAVVIDAVRASTTIVTALAHGAAAVVPVATPEEAWVRARTTTDPRPLLGGERGGGPPPGFDCGNSPAEYTRERVAGREVVFTTTNGTRALLAAAGADRVAVGGFVNAGAVTRWLAAAPGPVWLVCSGEQGRFCLEDAACAGYLVERLEAGRDGLRLSDGARAALRLGRSYGGDWAAMLGEAAWARGLVRTGRGADLPLCVAVDVHDVVPVVSAGRLVAAPAIDTPSAAPP
jgi:2-phosphosulfolactate phosphatase